MSEGLWGTRPEAVVELLRARRDGRPDPGGGERKLALVVEGGAMRGTLSAGSLLALDAAGYRSTFDAAYATSAGGVNVAYFLSGQGKLGITVYFDCINNRRFFNPLRFTKMVDVAYVYDHVIVEAKPLDEEAVRRQPTDFFLGVTDAARGENVLLDVRTFPEPISRMLKASSALPILYNRTVELGGRRYVDGGVTTILPIFEAVAAGATDLLIIVTREKSYRNPPHTGWGTALLYAMMGRRYPGMMTAHRQMADRLNRDRRVAVGEDRLPGVNVATLGPTAEEMIVGRTTIQRDRLVRGAHHMARRTLHLLGDDPSLLDETFAAYAEGGEC